MQTPRTKKPTREVIRFGLVVVAIFVALVVVKVAASVGAGKPCKESLFGCRFGLECAGGPGGHLCRQRCDAEGDCPAGQHCGLILSTGDEADRVSSVCF
jgi:hypothetical protein